MGMRIRMRRIARLRGSTMARYCKYCSYCTVLTLLWSILSLLSAVLTSLGLYFSNWLQRETSDGTFNSVSAYRLCLNESSQLSVSCDSYFTFSEIYSAEWQAVTLLMGLGVCLLVFIALLSIFVFFVHKYCNKFVVFIMALLQCLGVLLCVIAIILFPSGMSNDTVQHPDLCGPDASSFTLGDCDIGWAYIIIIIGATIGIVAVTLSWTPIMWNRKENETSRVL